MFLSVFGLVIVPKFKRGKMPEDSKFSFLNPNNSEVYDLYINKF